MMNNTFKNSVEVIEPEVKIEVKQEILEEKQVIVHCSMSCNPGMLVRIWKSTYLLTEEGERIPLLYWDGISLFPQWTPIYHHGTFNFTLIFAGLSSNCKVFSLIEEINQPGGFCVENIRRNRTDVYRVEL
jgi:hypothetical protein